MNRKLSPEGRLLAIIKDPPKGPGRNKPVGRMEMKKISSLVRPIKIDFSTLRRRAITLSSRSLVAAFIVLSLYLGFKLLFVRPTIDSGSYNGSQIPHAKNGVALAVMPTIKTKDYLSYEKQISSRALFGQGPASNERSADISTSDSLPEYFGLVGIIPGENPKAIIEDKKGQKVYYLNKGESFNGFIVDEIADGKVELVYEGKRIELLL
jgi:hypothetical protein